MPKTAKKRSASRTAKKTDMKKVLWDLSNLYSSREDPQIEKDFKALERSCKRAAKLYRGRVAELDVAELKQALALLERIDNYAYRLIVFANLEFATKSNDPSWGAYKQKVMERFTKAVAHLDFFQVEWNALDKSHAEKMAQDPALERYRHYLEHARKYKPHTLTEAEEILTRKFEQTGAAAWTRYYNTVLADIDYKFRGKSITESELTAKFQSPDRAVRRAATEARSSALMTHSKPLTFAFNMVLASGMVRDDVRSYDHWVQQRNLANEIPDKVVDALAKVMLKRVDILQRYMKLKGKLLKVRPFMSYDIWAPLPGAKDTKIDYDKAAVTVTELFEQTRPSFGKIARQMFDLKHVDVPPYKGKRAGAFCSPNMRGLPYVLLNWTGKMRDIATLAHEFGHAVHMELSRKRGPLGAVESLVMAEVASVFMESLLYERLLKETENPRQRLDLLRVIIEDGFATTFRQMQFNRFENAVHNHRRDKGELTSEEIGDHFRDIENTFFGDCVKFHKNTECFWMYVNHFVNVPGYVYAYCASYLVVLALYRRYQKEGKSFLVGYEKMLAAGGSKAPEELLADLGVDWSKSSFWHGGLDVLSRYVDQFEATARELKLIK